jgi:hypothetical protein
VKVPHQLSGVFQVFSGLRGKVWISYLFDSVVETGVALGAAILEGINYLFNLELFYALYFHRQRRGLYLSRGRVIGSRAEQVDVEYRVYSHGCR